MQKYHDEPKQYKGYLKSALARLGISSATAIAAAAMRLNLNLVNF